MLKNKSIGGGVAIAIAAVLWGLDGVVLTPRLFNLNVGFVVMVLHVLPFLLMNFFLRSEYSNLKCFNRSDFAVLIAIAATGGSLGTLAIVKALFLVNFQQLSVVVLLQKLQPVFAILLAGILLKEKITRRFMFWALVAVIAGYFLTFEFKVPTVTSNKSSIMAALFALLAAFCFGSSTVLSKMVLNRYSFQTVTFYRYGFTSVIMIVWVLLTRKMGQFSLITPENGIVFLIIGITTGSGAIFLYYYGLRQVRAIVSVILELLFPLSAIVFDYIINNTQLSAIQWLSAALLIYAIVKINFRGSVPKKIWYNIKNPNRPI
ncbi:MAG: EamA family transporter [Bacteroidetes bacterium HGW-Bacteroidetes-4]|jgi:drug/metabolite transporter (DMT)-like permease|nr:MAG: EamA family transporter [Bacteroidetes bacterium HGW-Bacteroidetes-4]